MKIIDLDKKAIDNFLNMNNSTLEQDVLLSWKRYYGVSGTPEQAKTFVSNSKSMLSTINLNQEINSNEIKIMLSVALSKYSQKLGEDLKNTSSYDSVKVRRIRDEKLSVEQRALEVLPRL